MSQRTPKASVTLPRIGFFIGCQAISRLPEHLLDVAILNVTWPAGDPNGIGTGQPALKTDLLPVHWTRRGRNGHCLCGQEGDILKKTCARERSIRDYRVETLGPKRVHPHEQYSGQHFSTSCPPVRREIS